MLPHCLSLTLTLTLAITRSLTISPLLLSSLFYASSLSPPYPPSLYPYPYLYLYLYTYRYGAIAALQVPVQALPEVCSNSLLVALAGDLSLEGPSTVAHVLQLLHSCGFHFSLSSSSSSHSSFPVSTASSASSVAVIAFVAICAAVTESATSFAPAISPSDIFNLA